MKLNKLRRIYIDTNVLVGNFRGIKADVEAINYLFKLRDNELYTSVLAVSQTISTLQGKKKNLEYRQKIVDYVNLLMHRMKIIGMVDSDIKNAFDIENVDIEDNIQLALGAKEHCYIYVTNNVKDFKYNNIYAVKPKQIRTLQAIA